MAKKALPSYEKVNYSLRPSKHIERKMLSEALRRLYHFDRVDRYRYVGLGSVYFSDFTLFHRDLGIHQMISIEDEDDSDKRNRFQFNCPYSCIDLRFEKSTTTLSLIDWAPQTILWLDYDERLVEYMLNDIALFFTKANSGSVIIVSVNADDAYLRGRKPSEVKDILTKELNDLRSKLGLKRIPRSMKWQDLEKWGTARVFRNVINNHILEILSQRNGALPPKDRIKYTQLFNFHYADGAKMLTVGGVLHKQPSSEILERVFGDLHFIRDNDDAYHIREPKLTYRELRYLDKQLPTEAIEDIDARGIPSDHLTQYADVYRYFPAYADTDR